MKWSLLGAAVLAFAVCAIPLRGQSPSAAKHSFGTQGDHFVYDGKPFKVLAGEMHYARIPREYWRDRMRMARAMGLNTLATYVFWNVHEPRPGVFDFSGNADVAAFVRLAQQEGFRVLLRTGPYSCAEWDLGGFPSWLLATPESAKALRSNDPLFTDAVDRWMTRLAKELAPLQVGRGGPIIATQIENEYGNFGSDHAYMAKLHEIFVKAGFTDSLLYTADNWRNMPGGVLPGILAGTNFGAGNGENGVRALEKFRPGEPLFVSEYWPGWFDHWGQPHATRPLAPQLVDLEYILSHGAGINIYMFHGGTSFGFMAGASWTDKKYLPDVTSYDYDAPLDEAGHPTPKYHAYRELLAKYAVEPPPPVPAPPPVVTVPPFALAMPASLWNNLPAPILRERPEPMEYLGQSFGYILYRRALSPAEGGELVVDQVHDYALVFLDGVPVGTLDRRLEQNTITIPVWDRARRLDILVENSGRVNTGTTMRSELKGITREVRLNGTPLTGWQIYCLTTKHAPPPTAAFDPGFTRGPTIQRGGFTLTDVGRRLPRRPQPEQRRALGERSSDRTLLEHRTAADAVRARAVAEEGVERRRGVRSARVDQPNAADARRALRADPRRH